VKKKKKSGTAKKMTFGERGMQGVPEGGHDKLKNAPASKDFGVAMEKERAMHARQSKLKNNLRKKGKKGAKV
jgi:hypothetical protein